MVCNTWGERNILIKIKNIKYIFKVFLLSALRIHRMADFLICFSSFKKKKKTVIMFQERDKADSKTVTLSMPKMLSC